MERANDESGSVRIGFLDQRQMAFRMDYSRLVQSVAISNSGFSARYNKINSRADSGFSMGGELRDD
jgi:hypothetical protein